MNETKVSTIEEIPSEEYNKIKIRCDDFNHFMTKLTPLEYYRYKKFCDKHLHKETNQGAIGGTISLIFSFTSIGIGKVVRCGICGEEENITDYDIW